LLRGREFVMKDSYSFDVDDAGLERSYQRHRDAYIKTFDRLGLDYVIVSAMSGAMGGSKSEEFMQPTEVGEDTFVRCGTCNYAANVEAVATPAPPALSWDDIPAAHVEDTPDTPTIETLVAVANARFSRADGRDWIASDTLKNVVVMLVAPDGTREPLCIGLPGDREVDVKRLEAAVAPAEVEAFTEADFAANPALVKGYLGPGALGEKAASGIRYLLDPRVVPGTAWITGADSPGRHVFDLVADRDFTADGTIEAAEVRDGDTCPHCGSTLRSARGIEIGHIFQLGRKYADALGLRVLDESGRLVTVTMGSYGIGVSRALAAIVESTYDEFGLCWPREVAPADVHLVATGKDRSVFEAASALADQLDQVGVRVIYDDRPKVSPGVKFKDAELLGMPTIVVVGKGLAGGTIEVKDRRSGSREEVALAEAVERITAIVRGRIC
jgi:prolyl-tRNA synthetase